MSFAVEGAEDETGTAHMSADELDALRQRLHEEQVRRALALDERDDIEGMLELEAQRTRQAELYAAEMAVRCVLIP